MITRILIVGLGSIGKRHLRIARELFPNADIRILRHRVCNEVPEYSNGIFFTIEDALTFTPQIAVIASPAPFHINTARALAEIGVHLLVEKPLSVSLSGVAQLLEVCQKQSVVLLTGYNLRFLPSLQRYRDLLSKNIVGRVLSVRCEIGHEIDYLRWIFGEVDWVKATLSRQSNLEIDVEDTAHLVLGFSPTDDGHQLIGSLDIDFIRHDTTRLCMAIGEKGSLRWNGLTGEVELYAEGEKEWRKLFSEQNQRDACYFAEWKNFIDCVIEQKVPLISGEDGLKVLQIIEAARNSAVSCGQLYEIKKIQAGEESL